MNIRTPESINEITSSELSLYGIKGITFDIENVLVDYGGRDILNGSDIIIKSLVEEGVSVALATNSRDHFQVDAVRENLGVDIPAYCPTDLIRNKLQPDMFMAISDDLGIDVAKMAHVDDQLKSFVGAVRAGYGAGFWLKPIGDKQHRVVKAVRPAESVVRGSLKIARFIRERRVDPLGLTD